MCVRLGSQLQFTKSNLLLCVFSLSLSLATEGDEATCGEVPGADRAVLC